MSPPVFVGGWDLSASYLHFWDHFPAAFREILGLGLFGVAPEVRFLPRYTRITSYGATLSKSFGRFVLNAEGAFITDKFFGFRFGNITDLQQQTLGEAQKDFVKYATGLDWTFQGADLSVSFIQSYIIDWEPQLIQDEFDTVLAFFGRKECFHSTMVSQLLALYFVNDTDWLVRPKLDYRLTDRVKLATGADIIIGDIGGPLPGEFNFVGFFRNNTRVFFEIAYGF